MSEKRIFLESNPVEFTFSPNSESKEYTFNGIAYSGKPIARHGFYENLIIDTSNIRFKKKVPIYRDHESKLIAGYAKLKRNDDFSVSIEGGKLLETSQHAAEIRDFASEGFEWEMSVGLAPDMELQILRNDEIAEVNGKKIKAPATIIRNARISEVSFVPVGADDKTSTEVFNQKQGDLEMEKQLKELQEKIELMEKEQEGKTLVPNDELEAITLACSCQKGATSSEVKAGAEEMKSENEKLKKQLEEMKKKLAEFEKASKKKKLSEAAEGKVELSEEKVEELLEDESKFSAYLEVLEMTKKDAKIDSEFTKVTEFSSKDKPSEDMSAEEIRLQAEKLVKEGKYKSVREAIIAL